MTGRRTREVLVEAERRLRAAGITAPRVDAELLLAHVLGVSRTRLPLVERCAREEERRLESLLLRRLSREPLQHILGWAAFRDLVLAVGPGVFIPRPETEIVVDVVRRRLADDGRTSPVIVEAGTGSGAIALSLAVELPGARVHAFDVSEAALGWAERNRATHAERVAAAGSTVTLDRLDCAELRQPATGPLGGLSGQVDVLVSNPPYIPDGSTPREPEVALHDPPLALYGGPDGLTVIGHLREGAGWLLRPRGWLIVEHADSQGAAGAPSVPGLLAADPRVTEVHDTDDLTGRPRVTSARFTGAGHR